MTDWKQRLKDELQELEDRTQKLSNFMNSDEFKKLSAVHQEFMTLQFTIMISYGTVLEARVNTLEKE